jgi:uncharacterized protein
MPPAPVSPTERIGSLDVLRGLALLGVLAVNVGTEFRVSIFEQFLPPTGTASRLDRAVEGFLALAVQLKALALFSFLFDVGLAIQLERLSGNVRRITLIVRRLLVLLSIGLAHLFLIWNGDILAEYALAGLVALPLLLGPRWLPGAGALLFLGLYLTMPLLPPVVPWPTAAWMMAHVAEANIAYATGGFWEVLQFRIREVPSILPLHVSIFPRTIGLFLLGVFVWRTGALRRPAAHLGLLGAIIVAGILVGGGLSVAVRQGSSPVDGLATLLLASGYGAVVISATQLWPKLLMWAAPLGRMAFTNYLAQSVIFGFIFYGYGLGLFGHLRASAALAIGIAVCLAQIAASTWWLRHYRFGPVEWLWRTAMYGKRQPIRLR